MISRSWSHDDHNQQFCLIRSTISHDCNTLLIMFNVENTLYIDEFERVHIMPKKWYLNIQMRAQWIYEKLMMWHSIAFTYHHVK